MLKKIIFFLIIINIFLLFTINETLGKYTMVAEATLNLNVTSVVCKDELNTYYDSLDSALECRRGESSQITLLDNVKEDISIDYNSFCEIELNNYTLFGSVNIADGSSLTIKNGSVMQDKNIETFYVLGDLNISNAILKNTGEKKVIYSTGNVNIENSTIIGEYYEQRYYPPAINTKGGTLNCINSTITSTTEALDIEKTSDATVKNSTINGFILIMAKSKFKLLENSKLIASIDICGIGSFGTTTIDNATIVQEGSGTAINVSNGLTKISNSKITSNLKDTIEVGEYPGSYAKLFLDNSTLTNTSGRYALHSVLGEERVTIGPNVIFNGKISYDTTHEYEK